MPALRNWSSPRAVSVDHEPSIRVTDITNADAMDWFKDAVCTQYDPETFWPGKGNGGGNVKEAKAICGDCPVRLKCLQWALDNGEAGIWGGTTVNERKRMGAKRPATSYELVGSDGRACRAKAVA